MRHPLPAAELFKAYDIRGIVDTVLTPTAVRAIGHAIGIVGDDLQFQKRPEGRNFVPRAGDRAALPMQCRRAAVLFDDPQRCESKRG